MKIDKVILSANENKDYIDFWPLVSKAWERIGIEPILIYTGKSIPQIDGNVIHIHIPFIKSSFVAQNARLLVPALFPNDTCIISDIDNMPLSEKYFQTNIAEINDSTFVVYRPEAVPNNMISIMWNVAKGSVWAEIFNVKSINHMKVKLFFWYFYYYNFKRYRWYTDQILLKKFVEIFQTKHIKRIVNLSDKTTGFNRIDRSSLDEGLKMLNKKDVIFSDFHMPRPLSKYKNLIIEIYEKAISK